MMLSQSFNHGFFISMLTMVLHIFLSYILFSHRSHGFKVRNGFQSGVDGWVVPIYLLSEDDAAFPLGWGEEVVGGYRHP
jgi:hypothetical protein